MQPYHKSEQVVSSSKIRTRDLKASRQHNNLILTLAKTGSWQVARILWRIIALEGHGFVFGNQGTGGCVGFVSVIRNLYKMDCKGSFL
ncbi:hypothetical protein E2542_SST14305 [Spatholobus suberectus]|nr:hypothetical protein E2542_SST14305 [Spatholobus suberectus]